MMKNRPHRKQRYPRQKYVADRNYSNNENVNSKNYSKALKSRKKYQDLASEAAAMGDRVAEQSYLQLADHHYRTILEYETKQASETPETKVSEPGTDIEAVLIFDNTEQQQNEDLPVFSKIDEEQLEDIC